MVTAGTELVPVIFAFKAVLNMTSMCCPQEFGIQGFFLHSWEGFTFVFAKTSQSD